MFYPSIFLMGQIYWFENVQNNTYRAGLATWRTGGPETNAEATCKLCRLVEDNLPGLGSLINLFRVGRYYLGTYGGIGTPKTFLLH